MGMSYCLQHMHQSDPPVTLPCLRSNTVFLTDDYAAKVHHNYHLIITVENSLQDVVFSSTESHKPATL